MDLICYICQQTFGDLKTIFQHLKRTHFITDGTSEMHCLKRNSACSKVFTSFNGLRAHVKICKNENNQSAVVSIASN